MQMPRLVFLQDNKLHFASSRAAWRLTRPWLCFIAAVRRTHKPPYQSTWFRFPRRLTHALYTVSCTCTVCASAHSPQRSYVILGRPVLLQTRPRADLWRYEVTGNVFITEFKNASGYHVRWGIEKSLEIWAFSKGIVSFMCEHRTSQWNFGIPIGISCEAKGNGKLHLINISLLHGGRSPGWYWGYLLSTVQLSQWLLYTLSYWEITMKLRELDCKNRIAH